jgi:N utilization substance protein B
MQALYAFFQGDSKDIAKGEREMFNGIDKLYELYHLLLLLLVEIRFNAVRSTEDAKNKLRPRAEDLNPNMRFIENTFLAKLDSNKALKKFAEGHKLSWNNEGELTRRILSNIRASETYLRYMNSPDHNFKADQEFILEIYKEHIADFELLENFLEEKNMFWFNDFDYVNSMVLKTIEGMSEKDNENARLMPLYKNEDEDRAFAVDLFRKTIVHDEENQKLIAEKTKNWEVDRIAMMDVLLMKMAITEILYFQTVPVKVSLNEYIEVSKAFSTPKSKVFINGILDKLVLDFKSSGRMQKVGRGLLE